MRGPGSWVLDLPEDGGRAVGAGGGDETNGHGDDGCEDGLDHDRPRDRAVEPVVALVDADLEETDRQPDDQGALPEVQMDLNRASTRLIRRSRTKPTRPMVMMQRMICS